jgi:hypothetical protein
MKIPIPQLPWWAWAGALTLAGVGVLAWHRYALDDQDTAWNTTESMVAPVMADLPLTPAVHGSGAPMSCNPGFRSRKYPGSLATADFSVAVGG